MNLDDLLNDDNSPASENEVGNDAGVGVPPERELSEASPALASDNNKELISVEEIVDFLSFLNLNGHGKQVEHIIKRIEDGQLPAAINLETAHVTRYIPLDEDSEKGERVLMLYNKGIDLVEEDTVEDQPEYREAVKQAINNYVEKEYRQLFHYFTEIVDYSKVFCDPILNRDNAFYSRLMEFDLVEFAIQRNTARQLDYIGDTLNEVLIELQSRR